MLCKGFDDDGDETYKLVVTGLEPGSYTFKVTLGGTWDRNYGQDGEEGGEKIPFDVLMHTNIVTFGFDSGTHTPSILITTLEGKMISN